VGGEEGDGESRLNSRVTRRGDRESSREIPEIRASNQNVEERNALDRGAWTR